MKNFRVTLASLLLLCLIRLPAQAQNIYLQASAYLDVETGDLIRPANLWIENGLIKAINPKSIPEDIEKINLGSQILLPGLLDMHVHLDMDFMPNGAYSGLTESGSKRTLRAARNAELTLMAGFTTVRNVGQTHPSKELIDVALSEAAAAGWIAAPRIIPCGHMISTTGGHGDLSMGAGFAEGVLDLGPTYGIVDGPDEALKATRFQIKHGAKAIKLVATAGVTTLEKNLAAQQLTNQEMETIVAEANRHGVTVAAHGHGTEGIIAAINAGVHSIEHGSFLNEEAIALMVEKGTYLVPTIALLDVMKERLPFMDPVIAEKGKRATIAARASHQKAVVAGVKIALGTDAPLVPHGQNGLEFAAMKKTGMTALAAIQAGTINAANLLELKDRGLIKKGLLADLIAVKDNPLENIQTLEQVSFVMKGGVVYKKVK